MKFCVCVDCFRLMYLLLLTTALLVQVVNCSPSNRTGTVLFFLCSYCQIISTLSEVTTLRRHRNMFIIVITVQPPHWYHCFDVQGGIIMHFQMNSSTSHLLLQCPTLQDNSPGTHTIRHQCEGAVTQFSTECLPAPKPGWVSKKQIFVTMATRVCLSQIWLA